MTFKINRKLVAVLLIICFLATLITPKESAESKAFAQSLKNIKKGKANIKYEKPEIDTKSGKFADEIQASINGIRSSIKNGDREQLKKNIENTKLALKTKKGEILEELSGNEKKLDKINSKTALERHNKFKKETEGKLNDLEGLINKLEEAASSSKELNGEELKLIEARAVGIQNFIQPEKPEQALGNNLPYDNINIKPPAPTLGSGISPAYMASTQEETGTVLPKTPNEGDIAETPEIKFTQDIKNLADSLQTPVAIYEYVRNKIDFEPYYGSRKGAEGTLHQMSGNDTDTASLLIAMLRYKGIPARYVRGTIEVPIEKLMKITRGETPEAAVKIIGSLGIPSISQVSRGKISSVLLEHVWVEAYAAYEYYRGAGEMSGQKIWVPLDPSFKEYSKVEGINIEEATGLTNEQLAEGLKTTGEKSADGIMVTNIDTNSQEAFSKNVLDKVEVYVKSKGYNDSELREIIAGKKIIEENLGLLPSTLPYKTKTITSEFNAVDDKYSDKISFSIRGSNPFNLDFSGDADFTINFKAVELYEKRITLSYAPGTEEDARIIDSFGGLFNTPSYMVKLKPQLKVDGSVVAEGKPIGLGYRQEFITSIANTGHKNENLADPVTVGGYYAIGLDYGKIAPQELKTIQERLGEVKDRVTEKDVYTDGVMGDVLNAVSKAYFGQTDAFNSIMSATSRISSVRLISEAMTGYNPKVKYMFMTPVEFSEGSFFIDVNRDVFGIASLEDKKEKIIQYMMQSGIVGSTLEHGIFEQILQLPSVSTIKILNEANRRGIPIYTFNKSNIDRINEISASSTVKTQIVNAVNTGKVVTIPKEEIQYFDWHGAGFIIMNPETGAAGYMISGGLAGGQAAIDSALKIAMITSLIWTICDTLQIAWALLTVTNPILGVLFGALFAVNLYATYNAITDVMKYWETGDYQYAWQLLQDLVINIVTVGIFKYVQSFFPGLEQLFKTIKNQAKEVADASLEYGDDIIEALIRNDGTDIIIDAKSLLKELADRGVSRAFIEKVSLKQGTEGLACLKYILDNGTINKEGIESLVDRGFRLLDVGYLLKQGVELGSYLKYGITNATEARVIVEFLQKGYRLEDLAKLVEFGYKPSGMIYWGIKSAEIATKAVEAITESISKVKSVADDFLNYVDGCIVKLQDGFAFRPSFAGIGDIGDEFYQFIKNSDVRDIGKVENVATLSGRFVNIENIVDEGLKLTGEMLDNWKSAIWKKNYFERGEIIEAYLAKTEYLFSDGWYHIGRERNGFFPVIDFWKGTDVISVKSIDPRLYSGNGATNEIYKQLEKLQETLFVIGDEFGNKIDLTNKNKILYVTLPKGMSNLINIEYLNSVAEDVILIFKEF